MSNPTLTTTRSSLSSPNRNTMNTTNTVSNTATNNASISPNNVAINPSLSRNLSGCWRIRRQGSDLCGHLLNVLGAPWSTLVDIAQDTSSSSSLDYLVIQQRQYENREEIIIVLQSSKFVSSLHNIRYIIGTINFGRWKGKDIFRMIASADNQFTSFSIIQLGPGYGQRCIEQFQLDSSGLEMKVTSEFEYKGRMSTQTRYFDRFTPNTLNRPMQPICYQHASYTRGWERKDYTNNRVLLDIAINMRSVRNLDSATRDDEISSPAQYVSVDGILERYRQGEVNRKSLPIYLIEIEYNETRWVVGHRYNEFKSLHQYITSLIAREQIKIPSDRPLPHFPAKAFLSVDVQYRRTEFERYLSYFLRNAAFENLNLSTLLMAFLEIPCHLQAQRDHEKATAVAVPSVAKAPPPTISSSIFGIKPIPTKSNSRTDKSTAIVQDVDARGSGVKSNSSSEPGSESKKKSGIFKHMFARQSKQAHESSESSDAVGNQVAQSGVKPAPTAPVPPAPAAAAAAAKATSGPPPPVTAASIPVKPSSSSNPKKGESPRPTDIVESILSVSFPGGSSVHDSRHVSLEDRIATQDSYSYTRRPQDILYESLQSGIIVLKHGRQGYPKRRLLRMNSALSRVYWDNPPALGLTRKAGFIADLPPESKSIALAEVLDMRRGIDSDPSQSSTSDKTRKLGTETLRRHCKPQELSLCFSFILSNRTLDIQCLSEADYNILYPNFVALLKK